MTALSEATERMRTEQQYVEQLRDRLAGLTRGGEWKPNLAWLAPGQRRVGVQLLATAKGYISEAEGLLGFLGEAEERSLELLSRLASAAEIEEIGEAISEGGTLWELASARYGVVGRSLTFWRDCRRRYRP